MPCKFAAPRTRLTDRGDHCSTGRGSIAPRAGARIETYFAWGCFRYFRSLPMLGRGSKRPQAREDQNRQPVALIALRIADVNVRCFVLNGGKMVHHSEQNYELIYY